MKTKSPIESAILGLRKSGMPTMADSIQSEHAALVAVAEAAEKLQVAGESGLWGAWADNTENGKVLKSSREALANLAAVREGK